MQRTALPLTIAIACACTLASASETIDQRPYEMVWANRTEDDYPPVIDFENLDGWTVSAEDAEAKLSRTREQQLWGKYVAKIVYRGRSPRAKFTIHPPGPLQVQAPIDCVSLWVYGNNWASSPNPSTPQVAISVILQDAKGEALNVPLGRVRWKEWWVMHRKLSAGEQARVEAGARVMGIEVKGCRNTTDNALFFDNLACYQETLRPLTFKPRPQRGIGMFPGQTVGTNTGPGRLPFPTREETILPDNLVEDFTTQVTRDGQTYVFRYRGTDGALEYRYEPKSGSLGDVTAHWPGRGEAFRPMVDGGVLFAGEKPLAPEDTTLVTCEREGDTVKATWKLKLGERSVRVMYTFRLWQKSLVVDVKCPGGEIGRFDIGRAVGVARPRLVTLPYLTGEHARPAVLVMGSPQAPLFLTAFVDHYRTNCSKFWFVNKLGKEGVIYNGGTEYLPKTDGRRNDCFERLFLTVSPRFEEILANIPNPKSPWMHVTGERVWRAHGASNRERDLAFWTDVARHGMTQMAVTDHESGWRDGGESFTFRTRTAPKKGGDESQAWYARELHKLGFRYGIYNNYTDLAAVNGHWRPDLVTRLSDGNWRTSWMRCYNPKPARAVEYEALLTPIIQKKFSLSTAYCDVHTACTPWRNVDFDARVPGAGTMAGTFYAYGEIMLHQKQVWNGPVYSEGRNHWYYSGLTDGNYGQDSKIDLPNSPWLVDFDLRKMHPLNCNFGMGNPGMFYGRDSGMGSTPAERMRRTDRFLAATLAFGHTGFLLRAGGPANMIRSYFMVQQVHKHYAQEIAESIRYGDEKGRLLDVSAAVATGAYKRSQVTTRYSNGLLVVVNGHQREDWHYSDGTANVTLSPNGYFARLGDGPEPQLYVYSTVTRAGHRADFAYAPAYIYANGRGTFAGFGWAACDGGIIGLRLGDGRMEAVPVEGCREFGLSMGGRTATAVALDKARNDLGPTPTRFSRGLVYVTPKEGAFSYLLTPAGKPAVALACARDLPIAGESVVIRGKQEHTFRTPVDSKPGDRIWRQFEGAWIDFTVAPLAKVSLSLSDPLGGKPRVSVALCSNLDEAIDATLTCLDETRQLHLVPAKVTQLDLDLARPEGERVWPMPIQLTAAELSHRETWWLKAEAERCLLADLSKGFEKGMRLRGKKEEPSVREAGSGVYPREMTCGNRSMDGIFMHPPYKKGTGYSFALSPEIRLPDAPATVIRCFVGKKNGSDLGDGILFKVAIAGRSGVEEVVAERTVLRHEWLPLEVDLSRWAGQAVRVKLISDAGVDDNSSGDWACWGRPVVETRRPLIRLSVHRSEPELKRAPGPHPVDGLTIAALRSAKRGWLHYDSLNLAGPTSPYRNEAELNGVNLGRMIPSSGGRASRSIWGSTAATPLTPQAVAKLGPSNRLVIHNRDNNSFKMRRFWIELELADGRKCSSRIETPILCQPGRWLYAEGKGVKFGENMTVEIVFDVEQ